MIQIQGLNKTFYDPKRGEIKAVRDVHLKVEQGEIFGVLGPNGAGKTTLLRMLGTVLTPTSGAASVNCHYLSTDPDQVKRSIGYLSGNTKLYGRLTPRELLTYFGRLYDMTYEKIRARCEEVFRLLDMTSFSDQRIDKLSTGQTQKTSIARCILHEPPVLILDEPTLGLDILTGRTITEFIKDAAARGITIVFSTHYMHDAERLCHRIALMHKGAVLDVDTMAGYREKTGMMTLSDVFLYYIERHDSSDGGEETA